MRAIRAPAPLPLFATSYDGEGIAEPAVPLPVMTLGEAVVEDYPRPPPQPARPTRWNSCARACPASCRMPRCATSGRDGASPSAASSSPASAPAPASGVIFLTLEDETGVSNVVVWTRVYERFRRAVLGGGGSCA